jgi:hypothetical protein
VTALLTLAVRVVRASKHVAPLRVYAFCTQKDESRERRTFFLATIDLCQNYTPTKTTLAPD